MRRFFAIVWRETGVYFVSPMAYLILTAFLFVIGFVHVTSMVSASLNLQPFEYRTTLEFMSYFIIITCPYVTARLVAEEKRNGTLEMVFTAPVRESQFILAKFTAAMFFIVYLLAFTIWFVILSRRTAVIDYQATFVGYIGILLMSSAIVSVGLFISTVCPNQVVAGILTLAVSTVFMFMHVLSQIIKISRPDSIWAKILFNAGLVSNTYPFFHGIIDTRNLIYLLSYSAFFLFLSIRFLTVRRLA